MRGKRLAGYGSLFVVLLVALAAAPPALGQTRAAAAAPLALAAVQEAELTGNAAGDQLGYWVALSGDTALVGAPAQTVGGNSAQGAAYVYVRSGGAWTLQATLAASDGGAGDNFGEALDITGNTALVAAPYHTVGGNAGQGAVYVFTRSGTTWTMQAELTASTGAANDNFGFFVALSGDTALIGANGANGHEGAAYVFTRTGSSWSQQGGALTASDGAAGDQFGFSVALSGETAMVAAITHKVGVNAEQGAVYVFTHAGGSWSQVQEVTATDGGADDLFGFCNVLSGDTALVTAIGHSVNGNAGQGVTYVFTLSAGTWSQTQELTASDGDAGDQFGSALALSGSTALVGAQLRKVGGNDRQGAAYVFTRAGGTWGQQGDALTASDGAAGDEFGFAVAVSAKTALVGTPYHGAGGSGQGAAYLLGLPCTVTPSVPGGHGTISPAGAQTVDYGTTPIFSFTADAGYHVGGVTVDGAPVRMSAANVYTFPALTADHALSVSYLPAPTVTVRGLPAGWARHAVRLRLRATAAAGSAPVAFCEYRLGAGTWKHGSRLTIRRQGATRVFYRAADTAGNFGATRRSTVRIDSLPPTVADYGSPVAWQGGTARLPFGLGDAAVKTLRARLVLTRYGRQVAQLDLGRRVTGRRLVALLQRRLPAGAYAWRVVALSPAGNRAAGTSRPLTVYPGREPR